MRRLAPFALVCLGCSQPNPAFDLSQTETSSSNETEDPTAPPTDTGDGDGEPGDGDGEPTGDGDGDGSGDGDGAADCEGNQSEGIGIIVGEPEFFGGECPPGQFWPFVQVVSAGNAEVSLTICGLNCEGCGEGPTLSLHPLAIDSYLKVDGQCLALEVGDLIFNDSSACYFGALTVWNTALTPLVVATSHASPPTPVGAELLAGVIPEPKPGFGCDCDSVGQANDCCYSQPSPTFFYYPMDGKDVYADDYHELFIDNPLGLQHWFKVVQAERIASCENPGNELQTSWAVVAE